MCATYRTHHTLLDAVTTVTTREGYKDTNIQLSQIEIILSSFASQTHFVSLLLQKDKLCVLHTQINSKHCNTML